MITVERTVEVERPLDAVFAYLSDFVHTVAWDPGTIETTRTDHGPIRLGARFHNISEYRGRRTELDYALVRFEPGAHLTFTGTNKTVEATDDLAFRAAGESTTITYRAHFRFKRWVRLAEPFLRRGFEPIADETVAQLRATLLALT